MAFQAQFATLFASIDQSIELTTDHQNGTCYFDGLSKDKTIGEPGERFTFTAKGRKGVVLCCASGNVVIFQRYTNRKDILYYHVHRSNGRSAGEYLSAEDVPMFEEAIQAGGDINATLVKAIAERFEKFMASISK